jgi:hypothetical protein
VQVYTPEKSTDQLAVWQSLIDALERLDADWQKAQLAGPRTQESSQLPANIVVTLVREEHTEPVGFQKSACAADLGVGAPGRQSMILARPPCRCCTGGFASALGTSAGKAPPGIS